MTRLLIRIVCTLFVFFGALMAHAQTSVAQLQTELISAWLVTVEGEVRTRTLRISGVEKKEEGKFLLDSVYGWTDGNQTVVKVEISQTAQERTLLLTTQPGSKIAVTQKSDGAFVGTFTTPNGETKGVVLEKLSDVELLALRSRMKAPTAIVKPTDDVPPSCSAFSGKWTGRWGSGNAGQAWLWVANIDSKCSAKISYLSSNRTPTSYETVVIKDGVLEWVCNKSTGGTCILKIKGDDIWGSYSNTSGGFNSAVFKKFE